MLSSIEVKVRFLKRAKSIRRRFEPFYLDYKCRLVLLSNRRNNDER